MFALPRFLRFLRSRGSPVPPRYFSGAHGTPSRPPYTKRLRVLVDMDGVIADFEGGFLKKYRAKYPNEPYISLENRRGFWVSNQYGELRRDLCEKAISIWESKNFFIDLEPLPGSVAALKEMSSMENTDVFICTSPIKQYSFCPFEKVQPNSSILILIDKVQSPRLVGLWCTVHHRLNSYWLLDSHCFKPVSDYRHMVPPTLKTSFLQLLSIGSMQDVCLVSEKFVR
uniref:5',3'-nucleotidase, mitochondrial n=1 Tax=Paramormyrops kingsleyae TaxID=1676925 RepID=A0A3B3QXK1_9TELE